MKVLPVTSTTAAEEGIAGARTETPARGALRARILTLAAGNAILAVLAFVSAPAVGAIVPGPLRMLASALLVLVVPGAAWLGLFRRRPLGPARLALAVVGLSSVASIGGLICLAAASPPPSRAVLLLWTAVVVNAGLLLAGPPARLAAGRPWGRLAAVALAGFLVAACAGLWLVPPLEDHDMEVRGTAWGLATTLEPYFQTNRTVWRAFAHPILFHVHVADSLVLMGEIEATRGSYDSARRSEAEEKNGIASDHMDAWRADYEAFVARPALAGTRAPSALFAGLVLALLASLVIDLTGSAWAGIAAAALYAAFPQTVVRSAYAGYFAVTVFAMLAASMMFDGAEDASRGEGAEKTRAPRLARLGWPAAAGALAALVDHKTVVLVLGVTALASVRALLDLARGRERPFAARLRAAVAGVDPRAIALGAGFSLATFAWWTYGLLVDAPGFVRDHLRMHIAHRFLLNDVRLAHDADRYAPSIPELWTELARHTGYLFLVVALVGVMAWLFTRNADDRRAVLAGWCLCGCVLFSLTDWRQTKHLMNEGAPMVAASVCLAWPALSKGRTRTEDAKTEASPRGGFVSGPPRARGGARRPRHCARRVPPDRCAPRARLPFPARSRSERHRWLVRLRSASRYSFRRATARSWRRVACGPSWPSGARPPSRCS
jgi:hypothetical protein